MIHNNSISRAIELVNQNRSFQESFLKDLRKISIDIEGVTRESYSLVEDKAHELLKKHGKELGLEISIDNAHNTYICLPGSNRDSPIIMTGSHLDSQPRSGNYDGAAGVIAGLTALKCIKKAGIQPPQDIVLMACRAEETSGWYKGYHRGHIGSRAALGRLSPTELKTAIHIGDGLSLAEHFDTRGMYPDEIIDKPSLAKTRIKSFIELHIEQGPVLKNLGIPIGIVQGIRGNLRCRNASCIGEYTHSGGVPHEYRRDAVIATSEFIYRMDNKRRDLNSEGKDIVYSTGKLYTNLELHALTKVAGEVFFSVDVRSIDQEVLESMANYMRKLAKELETKHRVEFKLGEYSRTEPVMMDLKMRKALHAGSKELELNCIDIVSGGGHDAVEFSLNGVPTAMIFIRNDNGSHNPNESIDFNDLKIGTSLLTWALTNG
jgi:N-carbamoyl-L-amino-acid hydrolase